MTDGTPIERLAFIGTASAYRPGTFGASDIAPAPLRAILDERRTGSPRRDQLLFHSVGDGAIDGILDAMEATGGAATWSARRTRIEHGDLLFAGNFARAKALGAVVVQNGTHLGLTQVFAERLVP